MAFSFTKTGFSGFGNDPKDKEKLIGIKTEKIVTPNPPKEGYHTTGNTTTYKTTSTYASNLKTPKSEKRKRFDIAFGEASKKGLKTFPFEGTIYTTEKTPGSNTPKTRKEITSITATGVGIKKYKPTLTGSILDRKVPDPITPNKIKKIPPPPKKRPPRPFLTGKFKRRTGRTKVGNFLRKYDFFPFDNLGDYIQLPKKSRCGCK